MKEITVTTSEEAYRLARELSNKEAVLIRDNRYESDKHFRGVVIYVEK